MTQLDSKVLDNIYLKGAASQAPVPLPDGGLGIVLPDGYSVERIAPLEKPLPRIRQSVTFNDAESFVAYVNRYKDERTRIFSLPGHLSTTKSAAFTALLDYHKAGTAEHVAHIARFAPPYSEQWTRWTKAIDMGQPAFAEFIEENRKDIVKPEAASLLDIVSKFRAKKTSEYDAVVYQQNGDLTLSYSEKTEHAGKGSIVVPQQLELGIPVFFKGAAYSVPVFLRYKLREAVLTFQIKVDRADYIEQAAFDEISKKIADETKIEVYLGSLG